MIKCGCNNHATEMQILIKYLISDMKNEIYSSSP